MSLLDRFKKKKNPVSPYPTIKNGESDEIVLLKRMLSHNVRMPMAVISGYGELLKKGLLNDDEKEKCVMNICDNIFYMNQILKVLLDEENEVAVKPGLVNIVEIAEKMNNYVRDIAAKIPIKIEIEAAKPQMYIWAETIPLMKVFYLLFDNAFKYLSPGNNVQIRIHPVGEDQIMVVFRDDGPGVSSKDIPHLFDEGYRAGNVKGKAGTGYGLFNVKNTVEAYRGSISASGDINKGLSIVMLFPINEKVEQSLENL